MSLFEFKLPDIGEGVMEGEIVAWHVNPGDPVTEDQEMVEVMTDKATVTIGAPKDGTIQELRCGVGDVVPVGSVIVTLDLAGAGERRAASAASTAASGAGAASGTGVRSSATVASGTSATAASGTSATAASAASGTSGPAASPAPAPRGASGGGTPAGASAGPAATAVGDIKESLPGAAYFDAPTKADRPAPPAADHWDERPLATPATRKLARDLEVDLRRVRGTGAGGRITKEDVRAALAPAAPRGPTNGAGARPSAGARPAAPVAPVRIPVEDPDLEERTPFVGIRRRIAERMQRTKNTAAHFTFVEECDVTRLKALRARLKPVAEKLGVKLTFLPFIVKATIAALKKHPILNSALDEESNELVSRRYVHMGIAASTDQGLVVPVIRFADRMTLLEIGAEIERLGTAAKEGRIAPSELSGSTFTITSLGREGGLFATPVLNFPEVGILGVHRIKQRPVVRDGEITVGDVMLLSLSLDHRIVDGHVGAAFAYDVIAYLEDPDRLLLDLV
ncbi:MAG: dihydrolipoamide acetyltransferase family protein [Sandaracinaceae bacterium]